NASGVSSAFASVTNCLSVLALMLGLTTSATGCDTTVLTPAKSWSESYGSDGNSDGLTRNGVAVISSVCPSGAAEATTPVPTTVAAPGRFSTMTGTPQRCDNRSASGRATMSTAPPGT